MGLNAAALGLLALARGSGADFSRVVTIGRQRLELTPDDLQDFFRRRGRVDVAQRIATAPADAYCESLMKIAFNADVVQSIDASDYEQASIVHDMNTPLQPPCLYSVVLDFGTLEHIFNVAVAFDNVAALCAPGGYILHMLPTNNLCGHGFYQFSPELFFQIYSDARGFTGTRVFASLGGTPETWYEVRSPCEMRKRIDITSRDRLYLLVMTQRVGEPVPLTQRAVQQSDYVSLWTNETQRVVKKEQRRNPFQRWAKAVSAQFRHGHKIKKRDIASARTDMTRRRVLDLTSQF